MAKPRDSINTLWQQITLCNTRNLNITIKSHYQTVRLACAHVYWMKWARTWPPIPLSFACPSLSFPAFFSGTSSGLSPSGLRGHGLDVPGHLGRWVPGPGRDPTSQLVSGGHRVLFGVAIDVCVRCPAGSRPDPFWSYRRCYLWARRPSSRRSQSSANSCLFHMCPLVVIDSVLFSWSQCCQI